MNKSLDETDWKLLEALQTNARLSYTELGQQVGLSSPAVTERVRKLEDAGVITGYHAKVNLDKVGLPIVAIVYVKDTEGQQGELRAAQIEQIPEVIELYRTTGCDSMIIKIAVPSMERLTSILDQLAHAGTPSLSIVLGNSFSRHVISKNPSKS